MDILNDVNNQEWLYNITRVAYVEKRLSVQVEIDFIAE